MHLLTLRLVVVVVRLPTTSEGNPLKINHCFSKLCFSKFKLIWKGFKCQILLFFTECSCVAIFHHAHLYTQHMVCPTLRFDINSFECIFLWHSNIELVWTWFFRVSVPDPPTCACKMKWWVINAWYLAKNLGQTNWLQSVRKISIWDGCKNILHNSYF